MKKFKVLVSIGLCGFVLAACGSDEGSSKNASPAISAENTVSKESAESISTSNLLIDDPDFHVIASDNGAENAVIKDRQDYSTDWSDDSWSGVNISINSATVLKLDNYADYSDNAYEGFIILHFIVDNTQRDLNIFPQQATLSTSTGEQTEGGYEFTSWDGELMSGVKKEGYAAFPLNKLESSDDIESVRLKWNGYYDTDDYDDENSNKEYDVTVNFQKE